MGAARSPSSVDLDPEAAARTVSFEGRPLVDDLVATGWAVSGPDPLPNGWSRVTATKAFSQADQLAGLIEEVAGPNGPAARLPPGAVHLVR